MPALHQRGCSLSINATTLIRAATRQYRNTRKPCAPPFAVQFVRLSHDAAPTKAAAIVVGAGPAGIAVVGNLLENTKDGRIVWIDREFHGGRINHTYREVPGNTAVKLFVDYAKAVEPFRDIYNSAGKPNALTALEELSQSGTCSLSYAGDMLNFLTDGLRKHPRVESIKEQVHLAERDVTSSTWIVSASNNLSYASAPLLVYCTGSHPTELRADYLPKKLKLDTALTPSRLSELLTEALNKGSGPLTIGVLGGSHSAILVLMNLYAIAKQHPEQIRIRWFPRSETLKYAEQRDGYILNDNTGLKGRAAEFTRTNLDGDALATSPAGKFIERHVLLGSKDDQQKTLNSGLKGCTFLVQAIGYTRGKLPNTVVGGREVTEEGLKVNPRTGALGEDGDGLYGAGIAFPEEVDTPEGGQEMAVGMWKFMKYLKRVVPEWVEKTGADKR